MHILMFTDSTILIVNDLAKIILWEAYAILLPALSDQNFSVAIQRPSKNISQKFEASESLLNACDRIYWYLKQSLGVLTVLKISVNDIHTFAFCITGYIDDGWDNGCELIEIWDCLGNLIGSANIPHADDPDREVWSWKDRPIRGNDFYSPAPEW